MITAFTRVVSVRDGVHSGRLNMLSECLQVGFCLFFFKGNLILTHFCLPPLSVSHSEWRSSKVMAWFPKLRVHQLKTEMWTDIATLKLLRDFLQLCEKTAVKLTSQHPQKPAIQGNRKVDIARDEKCQSPMWLRRSWTMTLIHAFDAQHFPRADPQGHTEDALQNTQASPKLLGGSPSIRNSSFPSLSSPRYCHKHRDAGLSTSLPSPTSLSYHHCSPCDFGRGGIASGRSHLSQTSRRTGYQNLTRGKKTHFWVQVRIKWPEHFLREGKNEVTSRLFTWPHIPQGSLWNLFTITHPLVENKG